MQVQMSRVKAMLVNGTAAYELVPPQQAVNHYTYKFWNLQ
jgi:hypothetical protein